jgi:hypothetical protein
MANVRTKCNSGCLSAVNTLGIQSPAQARRGDAYAPAPTPQHLPPREQVRGEGWASQLPATRCERLLCSCIRFILFALTLLFLENKCQQATRHASHQASMEGRTSCRCFTALMNSAMISSALPAAMQVVRMHECVARDTGVELLL